MYQELIPELLQLATKAGKAILEIYERNEFEAFTKNDETPVTSADLTANQILIEGLEQLSITFPILSEESDHLSLAQRQDWQSYWIIDPLDGTGEFIARSDEFAVNIGLISNNEPVLGVIYAPVLDVAWYAVKGHGAFKLVDGKAVPIRCRQLPTNEKNLTFAISRRQNLKLLSSRLADEFNIDFIPFGSATLKACMVAEGTADSYVRLGPTGEWDTAAAECIVQEAGGCIVDLNMQPLTYNQRETLTNPDFMVIGDPAFSWIDIVKP